MERSQRRVVQQARPSVIISEAYVRTRVRTHAQWMVIGEGGYFTDQLLPPSGASNSRTRLDQQQAIDVYGHAYQHVCGHAIGICTRMPTDKCRHVHRQSMCPSSRATRYMRVHRAPAYHTYPRMNVRMLRGLLRYTHSQLCL